jgi:hypothetical protein
VRQCGGFAGVFVWSLDLILVARRTTWLYCQLLPIGGRLNGPFDGQHGVELLERHLVPRTRGLDAATFGL